MQWEARMPDASSEHYRERFSDVDNGLEYDGNLRSPFGSYSGLDLDNSFDLSKLKSTCLPEVQVRLLLEKVTVSTVDGLQISADIEMLDAQIRNACARAKAPDSGDGALQQDPAHFANSAPDVDQLHLTRALDPARIAFRAGKYRKARKALDTVDPAYRAEPLWVTFRQWVEVLGGGFMGFGWKSPTEVPPPADINQTRELCLLILAEEFATSERHCKEGAFQKAVETLEPVTRRFPWLPYVHGLLAQCLYKYVSTALLAGGNLDQLSAQMDEAARHALIATADKTLTDVHQLGEAIAAGKQMIALIQEEVRRFQVESSEVNAMSEQFARTLEGVKGGVVSADQFRDVRQQLRTLRESVTNRTADLNFEENRKQAAMLLSAVDNSLERLLKLEPAVLDSEIITPLFGQMSAQREKYRGGIRSEGDIVEIESGLRRIRDQAGQIRPRLRSQEGEDQLKQLTDLVDRDLKDLDSLRDGIREVWAINAGWEGLQRIIQSANGRGGGEREAVHLIDQLEALRRRVDLVDTLQRKENIESKDKLVEAIDRNLGILAKMTSERDDAAFINPITERLQDLLTGRDVHRRGVDRLRNELWEIRSDLEIAVPLMKSDAGREACRNLLNTVRGFVDQIER